MAIDGRKSGNIDRGIRKDKKAAEQLRKRQQQRKFIEDMNNFINTINELTFNKEKP